MNKRTKKNRQTKGQKKNLQDRNEEHAAKMEGDSARSPRAGVVRPVPTGQAETRARMRSSAGGAPAPPPTGDPAASWSQSRPATSPELPTASPTGQVKVVHHLGTAAGEFKSRGPPARRRHHTTNQMSRATEPGKTSSGGATTP